MIIKNSLSKFDIKKVCDILRRDDGVGAKNYVEQLSWLLFLRVFENVEGELKELVEADGKKYQSIIDPAYQWSAWAKKDWKDKDELIYFVNQKLFPYLKNLKGSKEKDKIGEVFRELAGNLIRSAHNLLDIIDILNQIEMRHFQDTHLLSQVYEEILQEMGSEGGWAGEFYTPRPIIRLMIKVINPKIGETIFDPFVGSGGFLVESFDYIQEQLKTIGVKEWDILQNKTFSGQEKTPLPYLIGTMNMMLHRILVPNLTRSNTFMEDIHNLPESSKKEVILTNPPFGGTEHQSVQNNFPIPVGSTEGLALQYVMKRLKNGGRCGIILPEGQIMSGTGPFKKIREELLKKFNVMAIISMPQGVFTQMGAGVKTNLIFFEKTGSTKEILFIELSGKFSKKNNISDDVLEDIYISYKERKVSKDCWVTSIKEIQENDFNLTPKNPNNEKTEKLPEPSLIISSIKEFQNKTRDVLENSNKIIKNSINEVFGDNDKGWKEVPFAEATSLITDFVANGSFESLARNVKYQKKEDYAILLRTKDYSNNFNGPFVYVDKNAYDFLKKSSLKVGDIVACNVGSVETVFRVPQITKPLTLGPNAVLIRSEYNDFLFYYMLSDLYKNRVREIITKSLQPKFNKTNFRKVLVPVPYKDNKIDFNKIKLIVDTLNKIQFEVNQLDELYNIQVSKVSVLKKAIINNFFPNI